MKYRIADDDGLDWAGEEAEVEVDAAEARLFIIISFFGSSVCLLGLTQPDRLRLPRLHCGKVEAVTGRSSYGTHFDFGVSEAHLVLPMRDVSAQKIDSDSSALACIRKDLS